MKNNNYTIQYYVVTAKCGHVGRSFYVEKEFPVKATSRSEAASLVRMMPRVKHHHKNAILSVERVDEESYRSALARHRADPFFRCKSKQEQLCLCPGIYGEMKREDTFEADDSYWLFRQRKKASRAKKERFERREARELFFA